MGIGTGYGGCKGTQERRKRNCQYSKKQLQRKETKTVKPSILRCLVKTHNRVKKPHGKTTDIGERVHPPKKERRGKENLFSHPPSASPEASPGYQADFQADP